MKQRLLFFLLIPLMASGQLIRWKWELTEISSRAYDVIPAADGGYLAVGTRLPGNFGSDFWLFKLDAFGNVQWDMQLGEPGIEEARSGIALADGGFLLAGYSRNGAFSTNPDTNRCHLVRIMANGNAMWTTTLPMVKESQLMKIKSASDGTFVVCGWKENSTGEEFDSDGYVARINEDGEVLWERTYGFNNSDESFQDLEATNDGGIILAGYSDPAGARSKHYLVKVNAMGDQEWAYFSDGENGDGLNAVRRLPSGDYIIGGFTDYYEPDPGPDAKMYLAKVNVAGHIVWESSPHLGVINAIELANDGNYVLGGYARNSAENAWGDSYIGKIDENGAEIWDARYNLGDADMITSIHATADGGYICSSWFKTPWTIASDAMRILKTDENGRINDLGVNELPAGSIRLFPNPSNGPTQLVISNEVFEHFGNAALILVDLLGREVAHVAIVANNSAFDCELLEKGIYSAVVVADGRSLYSEKLVVK